jgi:hypothetical protein
MTTKQDIYKQLFNKTIEILKSNNIEIPSVVNNETFKIFVVDENIRSLEDLKSNSFFLHKETDNLDEKTRTKLEGLFSAMIELIY